MMKIGRSFGLLFVVGLAIVLGACAAPMGPNYAVRENAAGPAGPERLSVGPRDQAYLLNIDDHTPFGIGEFPRAHDELYRKGYDMVRRRGEADFAIDISLTGTSRDNPERRVGNMIGGAALGAAAGAIIGAAAGDPGAGAAIGAASGGVIGGVAAPANTPMVRVDMTVHSFSEGITTRRSRTVDLANVPPFDVPVVIDNEVSRMLHDLPRR